MLKDVKIPDISENVTSGTIVTVLVQAGDTVAVDDVLVELETDKAVVEIPSPYSGKIGEVLVAVGDEINVGEVLVRIEVAEEEAGAGEDKQPRPQVITEEEEGRSAQKEPTAQEEPAAGATRRDKEPPAGPAADSGKAEKAPPVEPDEDRRAAEPAPAQGEEPRRLAPASPSVRRFARELGVDIFAVPGRGPDGRISQADVGDYVKQRLSAQAPVSEPAVQPRLPDFSRWGSIRTADLETVRRLTAESTGTSWRIVPHVTQFDEADITDLQPFFEKHAAAAEKQGGKLTITAVLLKVCAAALVKFPSFNASIDMEKRQLIFKDYIHIGLAVATSRGLLVPVIRDVPAKGILALAAEIVDMAKRSRDKKIKPDEFEGGTFTISNQGSIGGVAFTPVVFWPQAAILGVSRSKRMLVEKNGDFVPRTILPICLSYDHRIADGADAAAFLDMVCRSLEQPLTLLL